MYRLALIFMVFSLCATGASAQPAKPKISEQSVEESRLFIRQIAYASFLASSCDMPDNFREHATKLLTAITQYDLAGKVADENATLFDDQRKAHARNSNWWSVFKRCTMEKGKTRIFLDSTSALATAKVSSLQKPIGDYKAVLETYQIEQKRLEAERKVAEAVRAAQLESERRERISRQASKIVEEVSQYLIDNSYRGGRDLMKRVVEHEYYEPTQTYRIKVELEWRGRASGNAGYAANGLIEATYKEFNGQWRINDNLKWQPSWVSPALDKYLKCTTSIFSLLDCM